MLLTLAEVARRLGVSEKMARKVVQEFPGVHVGKRTRYPESAIHGFIARGGSARPLSVEGTRETAMLPSIRQ